MRVTGWKVDYEHRVALLERIQPVWPDIMADHVTLDASATSTTPLPDADRGKIVGHVNDGKGLQALVVPINGSTDRSDGSTYHITWSIDREGGRKPEESNDVLAQQGWEELRSPILVKLMPAQWP